MRTRRPCDTSGTYGDSDTVVVSALPDTAAEAPTASIGAVLLMGLLLIALSASIGAARLMKARR